MCENYIAQIMRENRDDHVVHGMLAYQMRIYHQSWSELKKVLEKTVPQINQNKIIIEKILHNHQESHKFWLKIMNEQAAPYDNKGKRQSAEAHPSLNVTA